VSARLFVHSGVRVKSIVNIDTHLSCMPMLTPLELLCAVSAATAFILGSGPYRLASHSGRRAIPTKHAHRSKRFCGHGAHVGRQVNAGEPRLNHSNPHADISKMTEGPLFELSQNGWTVWFCMMGLWTVIQILFNVARTVRDE
jgi:hypothetical protein